MKLLRWVVVVPFATTFALGQSSPPRTPTLPPEPVALVRSFYRQAVARQPQDVPQGAEMKVFAPFLSGALLHRMDEAKACSVDRERNDPEPKLKAEWAVPYGLFSGDDWGGKPRTFRIEQTEPQKDGSAQIFVKLTGDTQFLRSWSWRVVAVVLREDGRYVVDDVVYVNDSTYDNPKEKPADKRLSEYLAAGCDGPRWIGYSLPKEPIPLVQSLYRLVLARTPGGIPTGADWKIFSSYMSKGLLHRIDDFNGCVADWDRRPKDPRYPEKAPFGIFESGIFSGGDERTGPRAFAVEMVGGEKDGSVRVNVKLSWWEEPVGEREEHRTYSDHPYVWHVAPILVREDGRLVVEDVIYLKDETRPGDVDWRLSQSLSNGCKGPHWVGYIDH